MAVRVRSASRPPGAGAARGTPGRPVTDTIKAEPVPAAAALLLQGGRAASLAINYSRFLSSSNTWFSVRLHGGRFFPLEGVQP